MNFSSMRFLRKRKNEDEVELPAELHRLLQIVTRESNNTKKFLNNPETYINPDRKSPLYQVNRATMKDMHRELIERRNAGQQIRKLLDTKYTCKSNTTS